MPKLLKDILWWLVVFSILGILAFSGVLIFDKVIMPKVTRFGEEYKVPSVVGKTTQEADSILSSADFEMIVSRYKVNNEFAEGQIIEQNPVANAVSKKGRRIYTVVSSGSLPVIVPKLIGISPKDASYRITDSHLSLDSVLYDFSLDYPAGVVMDQSLIVGDTVQTTDTLFIVVSLGPHPSEFIVPDLIGKQLKKAVDIINKKGFKVGKITPVESEDYLPFTVIKQYPLKATKINRDTKINLIIVKKEEK